MKPERRLTPNQFWHRMIRLYMQHQGEAHSRKEWRRLQGGYLILDHHDPREWMREYALHLERSKP